jgi:hypothetical protein
MEKFESQESEVLIRMLGYEYRRWVLKSGCISKSPRGFTKTWITRFNPSPTPRMTK